MPDYWITTHWPVPEDATDLSRHVYVKFRHKSRPRIGDFIFVRESESASLNGKAVKHVIRCHEGKTSRHDLPKGSGGIIGTVIVDADERRIQPQDVVFDYGNLSEWRIIPCRDFRPATVSLKELKEILGVKNPRFLGLWKIPDRERSNKLLRAIGLS